MSAIINSAAGILGKSFGSSLGSVVQFINGGSLVLPSRGDTALVDAYKRSPWFHSVIRKISHAAAVVPFELYAVKNARDGKTYVRHKAMQSAGDPTTRALLLQKASKRGVLEEITEHPLLDLLATPNDIMSGWEFRQLLYTYLNILGEAFFVREVTPAGITTALWPVPPHWVAGVPDADEERYTLRLRGRMVHVPPELVCWIRHIDPASPYGRGVGTGRAIGDELDTDEYIAKFTKTWFYTRGRPDLIIAVEGGNPEELRRAKDKFESEHSNMAQGGRSFWHKGKMQVQQLSQKLVDMELMKQRSWNRDLIMQVYGVPPEVAGILENSNRATITEALTILATITTVPQVELLRSGMQRCLVPVFDDRAVLGYTSPIPDDKKEQLEAMKAAPWAASAREWRAVQSLPDRGEVDDVHMMPTGLTPVATPSETPVPPPVQPPAAKAPLQLRAKAAPTSDDMMRHLAANEMEEQLVPAIAATYESFANREYDALGLGSSFNMQNPHTLAYLEDFSANKVVAINTTTRDTLREVLVESRRAGLGAEAQARAIRKSFSGFAPHRALRIAVTEAGSAANAGNYQAQKQSGLVDEKRWLASGLANMRKEHAELHLEVVGIDAPFTVDGYSALHPGAFDVARMDINCHCVEVSVVRDAKSGNVTTKDWGEVWQAWDRDLTTHEASTEAAALRGFAAQEKAVVAAVLAGLI